MMSVAMETVIKGPSLYIISISQEETFPGSILHTSDLNLVFNYIVFLISSVLM